MTIENKLELLSTPVWTIKQIMDYTGIKSRTTATRLKERAFLKHDGKVEYGTQFVKRDAILKLLGTTIQRESEVIDEILQKGKIQEQVGLEATSH